MKTKRKNIFKSLLALTLALIMVLGVAPISELAGVDWASLFAPKAEAAEKTYTEGYYTYTVKDGGAIITDCDNTISGKITLPSKLGGYTVVGIGQYAFNSCWEIESIVIPSGVTSIGKAAFQYLDKLKSVSISNTVISIDGYAFYGCDKLENIVIPSNVKKIGERAFGRCNSLKTADIGSSSNIQKGYTLIEEAAFTSCETLYSLSIGDNVLNIGDKAFEYCPALTKIKIGKNVEEIGKWAFFTDTQIDEIIIPDKVKTIGYEAFYGCKKASLISLGDAVECINDGAFTNCTSATSVIIKEKVKTIGQGAFYGCESIKNVYYSESKDQWEKISIGGENECLINAVIHFKNEGPEIVRISSSINADSTSVSVGDSVEITFNVYGNANVSKKPNISIAVENPEFFEISVKNKKDCVVVKLTAKKAGTTTLTVTEKSTGEILYYSLNAVAQINAFDLNTVPQRTDILKNHVTNFYGHGGLIVDGMTSTKLSNGNYKVSMSVYNTKNIYGAVVTYYEDGSVCDYRMIDRFDSYQTGLWDVLKTAYYLPGQTIDVFRKYLLSTNGNLAQKTPIIDGIIVPKGGYMQITNNSEESAIAYLYNIINFAVAGTLSAAGVITTMAGINVVDKSNVASKTAAEAIMKTIKSMPKDKAADVMEDLLKDIAKQNMEAKSYDQIDDMIASTNNVLARAANIDMKSFISSSLKAVGISVAENVILSFLSTPGKWLSVIFTINSGVSYLDFSFSFVKSYKNTSIYVNAPRNGTISTMNGVKIDTQNNVDVKTVMQAFKIIDTSTITVNLSRNEVIEKSQIYNVYFTRDNEKVQPSGSVKIYLPLPDDYDPDNSYILRQESNGKWTKLETKRENDYLVAETDHFSLYAVAQVSKKDSIFKKILNVILAPFRAIINLFKKLFGK